MKFYADPAQAYGEAAANLIYRALKVQALASALFVHKDKLALVTGFIENQGTLGKHELTKPLANEILKGFVADVWLANWDALGKEPR